MNLGLENKIALVAASSTGLGKAVAQELAAEGARLILCARNGEVLQSTSEEIKRTTGASLIAIEADLTKSDDIAHVVAAGMDKFGQVDILVTNNGGPPSGQFENLTRTQWDAAIRLTLFSVLELTRMVLPSMKERGWGRVLNITSIAVKQPVDNLMLSNSIRAAVTGFARTLANEVATFGVTVNNIMPGYTKTERLDELAQMLGAKEGISPAEFAARWEEEIPMRRLGEPREFAALAAFLVSERASYITGQSIAVDGGWVRSLL